MKKTTIKLIGTPIHILNMLLGMIPLFTLFMPIMRYDVKNIVNVEITGYSSIGTMEENVFGPIASVFYILLIVLGVGFSIYSIIMLMNNIKYIDINQYLKKWNLKKISIILCGIYSLIGIIVFVSFLVFGLIDGAHQVYIGLYILLSTCIICIISNLIGILKLK